MWRINETFQQNDKIYRVLAVNSSELVCIDIYNPRAVPELRHFLHLEHLSDSEAPHKVDDPFDFLRFEEPSINSAAYIKRNKAYNLISDLIIDDSCFDRKIRSMKTQLVASNRSVSLATIYKYLRRYWQRGQIPNSLIPDYRNCGAPGKSRTDLGGKKSGRKRIYSSGEGIKISLKIEKLFHRNILANQMRVNKVSLPKSYLDFVVLFSENFKNVKKENYPTLRQYKYYFYKNFKIDKRLEAQSEKSTFNKDIRPLNSTATANVTGPGHRYEIDATIADIYLVDDQERDKIIGRPTVYIIIDVFSRMIAGYYIGFQNASYVVAMKTLVTACLDKVELCKEFGIDIESEDWPCVGLPEIILADRGEFMSKQVDALVQALNISVEVAPPRRGDAKGIVERNFKTIQAEFKEYSPGVVSGNKIKKHGERDYRIDARVTISGFKEAIVREIIYHNKHKVLKKYDRESDIPDDIPSIPLALWNWGIENRAGKLRHVNVDYLRIAVLPTKKVTISEYGVNLWSLFYTSQELLQSGILHRQKNVRRPQNLEAAYDPDRCDTIYLFPEKDSRIYWQCSLTDKSRKYSGLTFWKVWESQLAHKTAEADYLQVAQDKRIELNEKQAFLLNPNKQRKSELSDSARVKRIKGNKKEAKEKERDAGAKSNVVQKGEKLAKVIKLNPDEDYSFRANPNDLFLDDEGQTE